MILLLTSEGTPLGTLMVTSFASIKALFKSASMLLNDMLFTSHRFVPCIIIQSDKFPLSFPSSRFSVVETFVIPGIPVQDSTLSFFTG